MKNKGFTLTELMVVLGIISALIAVSLIGASFATQFTHDDSNKKYLIKAQQLLDKFNGYYNAYPSSNISDCPSTKNIYNKKSMHFVMNKVAGVDFLSNEAFNVINQMESHNDSSDINFSYCSSDTTRTITVTRGSGGSVTTDIDLSDAYIAVVNTKTSGVPSCKDSTGNISLIGAGNYTDGSGNSKTYKDLAASIFTDIPDISKCFL